MLCWLLLLLPPFLLLVLLLLPTVAPRACPGASLDWLTGLQQRVAWGTLGCVAAWQRHRLEHSTRHASCSQQQALAWCLRGAPGPRGHPRGSTGPTDMRTFRNHLPLTTASQAQEEESGWQEQHPTSSQYPREAALQATVLGLAALSKAYPAVLAPGATARLTPTSPWPRPLLWLGPILGLAGPPGAEDPQALLLAALRSPGLRALEAGTATELLDVFTGLEAHGEELARAIAAGHLGAPLPGRAAELQAALEQGPRGLALRLWPQLQVVVTLDAGGQAEAVAALRALWCQGLAFFSPAFAATGGALALSLWPDQPQGIYLLAPGAPFLELLPAKEGAPEDDSHTLLLAEAQQGEEYELVLTDCACLTRCRLGDVVLVVGTHNQCPLVRFVYRQAQTLSVRGEVTSERLFSKALHRAVAQWPGAQLLDHCCVESGVLGCPFPMNLRRETLKLGVPVIPVLRRLKQEDLSKFKARLGFIGMAGAGSPQIPPRALLRAMRCSWT
ncbi:GH3 domain-containing protein isoform X2 [Octodon degus]|uniref:GH3 domain-containing protein isoform X2 n=2 Tax=Octodon degus TaxID=10160 RepID=A0A6P6EPF5_OCTDE|nr:GH3 domain-containing protein isoform X2 [Octodon degus]